MIVIGSCLILIKFESENDVASSDEDDHVSDKDEDRDTEQEISYQNISDAEATSFPVKKCLK